MGRVLYVCRKIHGETNSDDKTSPFSREILFKAVASGNISMLDGLEQYLHKKMKSLSDTLCKFTDQPKAMLTDL